MRFPESSQYYPRERLDPKLNFRQFFVPSADADGTDLQSKASPSLGSVGAPQIRAALLSACFFLLIAIPAKAQQPFYTDDADVTERRKFHLQISNEFDVLQRFSYPSKYQNTTVFELDYGLLKDVEIGVDYPLIVIGNARIIAQTVRGFGDLDCHIKYNFLKEREGSWHPALTATLNAEIPTGDDARGLGSGFHDYFLNGIAQKSLTKNTKLRLNGGILFAGSTATGDIGIKTRGRVFVAGASIVKQFTSKLDLGAELTGAASTRLQVSHGQLQTLVGGNYQLTPRMSFDFGVVAGRYNTPRAGLQLGISIDF